ncbi:MAG TPA: acyl-CoA dehydrogenase family protein [Planctomycetota bacterium]|nr:acyl-CoA dehydrogenase family protein [Planctomycetota bacterium]
MDAVDVLQSVQKLAADFAAERAHRQSRRNLDPKDFEALRKTGFPRLVLPASRGGLWAGVPRTVRAISCSLRAMARGDASVALVSAMHPAVLSYWLTAPEDLASKEWKEQHEAVFRSVADGAWWGTVTSEPGSGGDVRKSRAEARRDSTQAYRITGRKHFGSGTGVVAFMITTAIPEGEEQPDWFFVDLRGAPLDGSRGAKVSAAWDGHGMTATQSHALEFDAFPATRFAWQGNLLEVSRRAGSFIACLFTSVVAGVVDVAVETAGAALAGRQRNAFEQTEWTRARMEAWLLSQAVEGMLRAVESGADARLEALQGKTAASELAETVLTRLCRILGGGTYSARSPFGWWFEDVRALGFLRPPWSLAFETLAELDPLTGASGPAPPPT